MPQVQERASAHKRPLAVAAALAAVLVAGGGAFYLWAHNNAIAADNQEYNSLLTETNQLAAISKFDQSASLWMSYAPHSPSSDHKNSAYLYAASMYLTNDENAKALAACQKAEAADGVTYNEAEEAASAAQNLGENSVAIHYYQKAMDLIPASSSDPTDQKSTFELDIQQLQAKS